MKNLRVDSHINSYCIQGLVLLILSLPAGLLSAQTDWEPANGSLSGVRVDGIAFASDGTPVIASGHGIYRIEEVELNDELTPFGVRVDSNLTGLIVKSWGKRLFVATEKAVYCSDDNGIAWKLYAQPTSFSPNTVIGIGGLLIVPSSLGTIGLYNTNGERFDTRSLPTLNGQLTAASSGLLFWVTTTSGESRVFRSDDTGRQWQRVELKGEISKRLLLNPHALSNSILAVGSDSGQFISIDAGATWELAYPSTIYGMQLGADGTLYGVRVADPHKSEPGMYAIMRSTDTGKTWIQCRWIASYLPYIDPHGVVYTQDQGQLVRAGDCSASWQVIQEGFHNLNFRELVSHQTVFYASLYRIGDIENRRSFRNELLRWVFAGSSG